MAFIATLQTIVFAWSWCCNKLHWSNFDSTGPVWRQNQPGSYTL